MFYLLLKPLYGFALHQFFERIEITGEPVESGPLLIIANHQDLALDGLLVADTFRRPLWFLGKATLFRGPIGVLLRALHVIPIHRKQDANQEPSGERTEKNKQAFAEVVENFHKGRAVVIFPEGVSLGERSLQPIKTGAARMLLLAHEHGIDVQVQAVGLTYTDLKTFGSSVAVTIAPPFQLTNELLTVEALTDKIEEMLRSVTVDIHQREQEWLVENIARLYRSRADGGSEIARFREIAQEVERRSPVFPGERERIVERLKNYFALSSMFGLSGDEVLSQKPSTAKLWISSLLTIVGVVIFRLPYRLVGILADRFVTHPVYQHSFKLFTGMALFAVWIALLIGIVLCATDSVLLSILFLLAVVISGIVANRTLGTVRVSMLRTWWPGSRSPISLLEREQDEIINELERLRATPIPAPRA